MQTTDHQPAHEQIRFEVKGMHCAGCVGKVERALLGGEGVASAEVDLSAGTALVRGRGIDGRRLAEAVRAVGFEAAPVKPRQSLAERREQLDRRRRAAVRRWRWRVIVGACIWLPLESLHWLGGLAGIDAHSGLWLWVSVAGATLALVLVGSAFYASAFKAALARSTNMDTLIAIGATAAFGLSVANLVRMQTGGAHDLPLYFTEAAGLLTLIGIGHWLEAAMTARAGEALRELLALQPDEVTLLESESDTTGRAARSADVRPGDLVLVRPGDRVAVDGEIVSGRSTLDESVVTGESMPVDRDEGDPVVAGSINRTGRLVVRATVDGNSTTVARIAELVLGAQSGKTQIQRLADRAASIFVPASLSVALLTLLGWWAIGGDLLAGVVNATTVLVISCPCALGLAAPTAVMVGSGAASKRGILVRTIGALERASSVRRVVFDKTGTLTAGRPRVVEADDGPLALAAALAASSTHPLSEAIGEAARERGLEVPRASDASEEPGVGLAGTVSGARVEVISAQRAARRADLPEIPADASASAVFRDGELVGVIAFRDEPRDDAREFLDSLRARGVETWLLSGDRQAVADAVGESLGFEGSTVLGDLSPDEKVERVEKLGEERGAVAMVGDGINDAAALAAAGAAGGVGIAIGTGSNVAIESADVVVPGDRLGAITDFIAIGDLTLRTIKQNLTLSFGYNALAIPAAAFGLLGVHGPIFAALAMALSDVSVLGNSLRLAARLRREGDLEH